MARDPPLRTVARPTTTLPVLEENAVPFAHCTDCGTPALIDPSGRCPEGHLVGAAGARVAAAIGSASPHPDEPHPWVREVVLEPVDLEDHAPRVARPLSVRSTPDVVGAPDAAGAEDLLRELHALGDLHDLGGAPTAAPTAAPTQAVAPAPPVDAPAPAPAPPAAPAPLVTPQSLATPAPPSSPDEATDLDELASLVSAMGMVEDRASERPADPTPVPSLRPVALAPEPAAAPATPLSDAAPPDAASPTPPAAPSTTDAVDATTQVTTPPPAAPLDGLTFSAKGGKPARSGKRGLFRR